MDLSIIIPVYNVEKYIEKCLSSFSHSVSDFANSFEIIVVNDGTKDNSMVIVDKFQGFYKNLIVVNQENKGLSAARNAGLSIASGRYIWFVDSDDFVDCIAVSKILHYIHKYQSDIFITNVRKVREDGTEIGLIGVCKNGIQTKKGIDWLANEPHVQQMAQAYIYERSYLKKNRLFFKEGILHEDTEFQLRVLFPAEKVTYIDECFYNYLMREGSIANSYSKKKFQDILNTVILQADFSSKIDNSTIQRKLSHVIWSNYKNLLYLVISSNSYKYIWKEIKNYNGIISDAIFIIEKYPILEYLKILLVKINPILFVWFTRITSRKI